MARFQEKEKVFTKHPKLEKALFWSLMSLFAVILVTLIVIIVLWIIGSNDDEDEDPKFEETYPTAELITFADLAEAFNTDSAEGFMPDGVDKVCVYIYSPDYTAKDEDENVINKDADTNLRETINKVIDKVDEDGIYGEYAFYVINITTEENEDYLSANSNFLTNHNIPTSNPVLITLGSVSDAPNGIGLIENGTHDANVSIGELINYLYDSFALNEVTE